MQKNVDNPFIDTIFLLNEKIYTENELGVQHKKIKQINIKHRLLLSDIFDFIEKEKLNGYIVTCNADIFFNHTLQNIYTSGIDKQKIVYCQLRFEYTQKNLGKCKLFGPRADSQDAWIFHSNFNLSRRQRNGFKFFYGVGGCDNKVTYLFSIVGFELRNDPFFIKIFHHHKTEIRDYVGKPRIGRPSLLIAPYIKQGPIDDSTWAAATRWCLEYKTSVSQHTANNKIFMHGNDNILLRNFIKDKLEKKQPFTVARIGGIEANVAYAAYELFNPNTKVSQKDMLQFIKSSLPALKNNAGIRITTTESLQYYSTLYLSAFTNADITLSWAPWDEVYKLIFPPHYYIYTVLKKYNRVTLYARVLDIFNLIYQNPWTLALRGKRILIISTFIESIKEKIDTREKIYGVDLFPDCEFIFLKPPQTQAGNESREFTEELQDFIRKVEKIKDSFDVALLSCGGYGILILDYFKQIEKSAIYVGGVLQMYFGIYGRRWLLENKDILNVFLNNYWSRPKDTEKPKNYKSIEEGCYF